MSQLNDLLQNTTTEKESIIIKKDLDNRKSWVGSWHDNSHLFTFNPPNLIKGNKRITLYDSGQFLSIPVVKWTCLESFNPS